MTARATVPVKMSLAERERIRAAAAEVGVPASTLMRNGALREADRVRQLRADAGAVVGLRVEYDRAGGGIIVRPDTDDGGLDGGAVVLGGETGDRGS